MLALPAPITEQFRTERVWGLAFVAMMLIPLMLIVSRVGFELCTVFIAVAFLWRSYRTHDWRWAHAPFMRVCLIAWAWLVLVVTPMAHEPETSLKVALSWIRFPLLFAALTHWLLTDIAARKLVAQWLALLVALAMIDSLWQLFYNVSLTGNPIAPNRRLTGPFDAPKVGLYISKLVMPATALLFATAIACGAKRHYAPIGLFFMAALTVVMLTGERTAFMVMALGAAASSIGLMIKIPRTRKLLVASWLALAMFAVITIVSSDRLRIRVEDAYHKVTNYATSDYGVLAMAGIRIGYDYPLFGAGLNSYRALATDVTYNGTPFHGRHPHHAYIEWFAEAGVVGLLLFISMIALLTKQAWHLFCRAQGAACVVPVVALGMLVQHFFPFAGMQSFFSNWAAMTLWFPLAVIFSALPREEKR